MRSRDENTSMSNSPAGMWKIICLLLSLRKLGQTAGGWHESDSMKCLHHWACHDFITFLELVCFSVGSLKKQRDVQLPLSQIFNTITIRLRPVLWWYRIFPTCIRSVYPLQKSHMKKLLTESHKMSLLQFATSHIWGRANVWRKVLWSDETKM